MIELIGAYNKIIEEKMIAACIVENGFAARIVGRVKREYFYNDFNRKVFTEIESTVLAGREPDMIDLFSKFEDFEITGLAEKYTAIRELEYTICQLENYYRVRQAGKILAQLKGSATEEGALDTATNALLKLSSENLDGKDSFTMRDLVKRSMNRWDNLAANGRCVFKLPFPKLEKYLKLRSGNLMYIIAPPKTGKTWFLCSAAAHLAKTANVLFISAEMHPDDLYTRFASHVCEVDMSVMDDPETMNKKSMERFAEKTNDILTLNITINNAVGISMSQLSSMLRIAYSRGFGVVFIDYLQRIHNPDARDMRQAVGQVSAMLADSAKKYNMLIICASQASRAANNPKETVTEIYQAKESGAIEADADVLLTLKDSTNYKQDFNADTPVNKVNIKVVQRSGLTFQSELGFHPTTGRYFEISHLDERG